MKKKDWILAAAAVALYALHQDAWLFAEARPLLLGFLPPGLSYHAAYIVLVALLMAALVRWAWPAHLERHEEPVDREQANDAPVMPTKPTADR